jgi:hypothetical protein
MAREYIPYNDAEFLAWMNNTNRAAKVHKNEYAR